MLHKLLPICLSHIQHCQQLEKGKKVAHHYAVSNRNVEIMYLKKISSSLLPYITRKNDLQCKYESLIIVITSVHLLLILFDKLMLSHFTYQRRKGPLG